MKYIYDIEILMEKMVQLFNKNLHKDGCTTGSYDTQRHSLFPVLRFGNMESYYTPESMVHSY